MAADRYLKVILTVIAAELLWIGAHQTALPALAQPQQQQQREPMPVVITGIQIGEQHYTTLPVAVVGNVRLTIPAHRELPNLQPSSVRVSDPIVIDSRQPMPVVVANQPLTVQTGARPLEVDAVKRAGAPGF